MMDTDTEKGQPTYLESVRCANCTFGQYGGERISIPVGKLVGSLLCPRCGCQTLQLRRW